MFKSGTGVKSGDTWGGFTHTHSLNTNASRILVPVLQPQLQAMPEAGGVPAEQAPGRPAPPLPPPLPTLSRIHS